ncbi:hypothetical protein [Actinoplanes derwentensis]|uniref:Uncharacterized protein n=1 Tax=Actinoplanes derwentensis TaxID=113562 RepID=A0A1H2CVW1_9ACTN|nr:hypothetical protein [Actinoplanes derwentensis]GID82006.1 hypothetical protein Ade03nite_09300 [Actinoplanes derwentensis]SDT74342.1 hypothetical protein SAMN04489716_6952 [Actinoplanes derwentensis]
MKPIPAITDLGALPQHPTLTHPHTGLPITAVGRRRDGQPIWPVIGGSQPVGGGPDPIPVLGATPPPAPQTTPQPQPQPQPVPAPTGPPTPVPVPPPLGGEHGFPPGTPVEQMTPPQQINFWRHHARRNQDQLRQYADYEQIKGERDQLRTATQTDLERAQATARTEGESAGRLAAGRQVVEAFFTAAAAGRLTEEQIAQAVAGLNIDYFMPNGAVDRQRVYDHVNLTVGYAQPFYPYAQPGPVALPPGPGPLQAVPPTAYGQMPAPYVGYPPATAPAPAAVPPGYGQPVPGYPPQPIPGQAPPAAPAYGYPGQSGHLWPDPYGATQRQAYDPYAQAAGGQPPVRQVPDYGQGPSTAGPQNGLVAGAARAAERHGRTRSQQTGG